MFIPPERTQWKRRRNFCHLGWLILYFLLYIRPSTTKFIAKCKLLIFYFQIAWRTTGPIIPPCLLFKVHFDYGVYICVASSSCCGIAIPIFGHCCYAPCTRFYTNHVEKYSKSKIMIELISPFKLNQLIIWKAPLHPHLYGRFRTVLFVG
jgi:hypothetical protein